MKRRHTHTHTQPYRDGWKTNRMTTGMIWHRIHRRHYNHSAKQIISKVILLRCSWHTPQQNNKKAHRSPSRSLCVCVGLHRNRLIDHLNIDDQCWISENLYQLLLLLIIQCIYDVIRCPVKNTGSQYTALFYY